MKTRSLIFLMFIMFLYLVGCRESYETIPTATMGAFSTGISTNEVPSQKETQLPVRTVIIQYSEMISRSAFQGENDCVPPCWFGITPGLTEMEEASEILKDLEFANDSGMFSVDEKRIRWYSGDAERVYIYPDEGFVEIISFSFIDILLSDVLQSLENPLGYYLFQDESIKAYDILFPKDGVIVTAVCPSELSSDCGIAGGYFIPIDYSEEMVNFYHEIRQRVNGIDTSKYSLTEWEGLAQ